MAISPRHITTSPHSAIVSDALQTLKPTKKGQTFAKSCGRKLHTCLKSLRTRRTRTKISAASVVRVLH
ncbi:hypothetical protein DENIT_12069 [Pseudomonas veronii]|nr:hypothetical protein DENIT_12069 [Pseudomonas veronii]